MEFYIRMSLKFCRIFCFNSQRDGILHFRYRPAKSRYLWFQFPTGWNSTSFLDIQRLCNGCFNSQRDGILPKLGGISTRASGVSIPNGMEFYNLVSGKSDVYVGFQFPTGWNSTIRGVRRSRGVRRFNSQRDGILPGLNFWLADG